MSGLVSSRRTISTRFGLRVTRLARWPTTPARVAEKSSVWRSFGARPMIESISSWNPMSSMRSASSSTRISTRPEVDAAAVHVVLEAAGGGDDDVDRLSHLVELPAERHAAHEAGGEQALAGAVAVRRLLHLQGKLARRREHQHARADAGARGRRAQALQAGQDEGRGLAAAGLRRDEEVAARQHGGNRFALHGRRLGIAEAREVIEQGRIETQLRKRRGKSRGNHVGHGISLVGANQNRYARPKGNLSTDCEGGGATTAKGRTLRESGRAGEPYLSF